MPRLRPPPPISNWLPRSALVYKPLNSVFRSNLPALARPSCLALDAHAAPVVYATLLIYDVAPGRLFSGAPRGRPSCLLDYDPCLPEPGGQFVPIPSTPLCQQAKEISSVRPY
mmetsp:Transcript_5420/g.6933  ORF Transcript_5420/g.6933 Transcript_5420/m.6933 type:complete len:113 (-) Transcript_5420:157-495(-)|eukprot:scaffold35331_cov26-Tisochrysis_lutea.AAC.3